MKSKKWIGATGALIVVFTLAGLSIFPAMADEGNETDTSPQMERCDKFTEKVAGNLGVSEDELTTAVTNAKLAMIDEALADGNISEEQAAEIKQRLEENDGICFPVGKGFHGPRFRHGPGPGHEGSLDTAVENGIITQEQADELKKLKDEACQQLREPIGSQNLESGRFGGRM